jgi:hypothetical protein
MKKCPFDKPFVWNSDGGEEDIEEFICEFLDDDTWECSSPEDCPYFCPDEN